MEEYWLIALLSDKVLPEVPLIPKQGARPLAYVPLSTVLKPTKLSPSDTPNIGSKSLFFPITSSRETRILRVTGLKSSKISAGIFGTLKGQCPEDFAVLDQCCAKIISLRL